MDWHALGGGTLMGATTVHVWTIPLDGDSSAVSDLLNVLSGEERVRAARFRTTELRLRYVVAHGAMRTILASYIGVSPAALKFQLTGAGKPYLPGAPVAFNLAHSDDLALCAVTPDGQVGIDVERLRKVDDVDSIVQRYFAPGEARQYQAVRPAERTAAFFSAWTRKEAFVKAIGSGLNRELNSFEVEVSPSAVCPRLAVEQGESESPWCLRAFAPRPDYVAAVALDREIEALEFFDWSAEAVFAHPQAAR